MALRGLNAWRGSPRDYGNSIYGHPVDWGESIEEPNLYDRDTRSGPPVQQSQPSMGMPPIGMLKGLMGGGGAASGTSGIAGAELGHIAASGAGGAGGGAAGGSGIGGAAAAGGPWAALAAVIIGNELYASKKGHRSGKAFGKKHIGDIMSTEVFNKDMEKRWLPKLGIKEDTKLSKAISLLSNPGGLNFKKQWGRLKDIF